MENLFEVLDDYPINDIRRLKTISDKKEGIFELIIHNLMIGIIVFKVNTNKRVEAVYINDSYYGIIGHDAEKYTKRLKDMTSTFIKEDEEKFLDLVEECNKENDKFQCIFRSRKSDNQIGWYNINAVHIGEVNKDEQVFLGFFDDVTSVMSEYEALKEVASLKEQLSIEREKYRILAETTPAILFEYFPDEDSMIFSFNFPENHERKIIHHYLNFLENTPLVHTSHIKMFKNALLEACKIPTKNSIEYLSEVSGKGYRWHRTVYTSFSDENGKIVSVLGRIYDVNEEVVEREKQANLAKIDALTGAYMRKAGYAMMESEVGKNEGNPAFLVMLDIDNFKQINDTKGHSYGDVVLKRFSQKAIELIEDKGFVIRYGGDEFLFFVRYESENSLRELLEELHSFCRTISQEVELKVDFSEGIVLWNGKTLSQAFEEADREMYITKNAKKAVIDKHC